MSGEIVAVDKRGFGNFLDLSPAEQLDKIVVVAAYLKDVIVKQKLSQRYGGNKEYAYVEAWQLLGLWFGIHSEEESVIRQDDGSYIANVTLVREATGQVVGRASALCSPNERNARGLEDFQIRSKAITRAVGKAYRLKFGIVMAVAGYETTPAEEMDTAPATMRTERTEAAPAKRPYEGTTEQQNGIKQALEKRGVPEELWGQIHEKMIGRYSKDLGKVIDEVSCPNQ